MTNRDIFQGDRWRLLPTLGQAGVGFALLWLVMFPVIGNALAYPDWDQPRRIFQARALGVAVMLLVLGRFWITKRLVNLQRVRWGLSLKYFLMLLALMGVQIFANIYEYRVNVGLFAVIELVLFLPWLYLALLVLTNLPLFALGLPHRHVHRNESRARPGKSELFFGLAAATLGFLLMAKGWWYGPSPVQGALAFGGSPIIIGITSATVFYMVLICSPFPWSVLFAVPYGYLAVMSTARTAWLGMGLMYLFYAAHVYYEPVSRARKALKVFLLPVVALVFILCLTTFKSFFFLYRVPGQDTGQMSQQLTQFLDRAYRFIKLLPAGIRARMVQKEKEALGWGHLSNEVAQKRLRRKSDFTAREKRLLLLLALPREERIELFQKSFALIVQRPQGFWPIPFNARIDMECGRGLICGHPHNIFLGAGYYFGWMPALVLLVGLTVATIAMIRDLLISSDMIKKLCIVGFGGLFIFMQVSGDFPDYFAAMLLMALWFFYRGSPATVRRKST